MISFKGKTVLVVDDEPDLREVLREELNYIGFHVLEAADGQKAFEIVQREKVDVIISDIRMPGGSGVELLDKLNAMNPRVPVLIFMSGFSDLTDDEAYHKGASGILSKPFDPDLLLAKLERLLEPIPHRWVRKAERLEVSFSVEIEIPGRPQEVFAKVINLGTGGMFIATEERLPATGDLAAFKLQTESSSNHWIEGKGMVRWVRSKSEGNFKRGFGIEFQGLDEKNAAAIFALVDRLRPKSFIPKV